MRKRHKGNLSGQRKDSSRNAETAVKVGEAVLMPVYGEKQILAERPFKATPRGSVWTVEGTLPCGNCNGGTALVKISKTSGQILFMTHYQ